MIISRIQFLTETEEIFIYDVDQIEPIPMPINHSINLDLPIDLELSIDQLRNGDWLTDIEINAYLALLKRDFPDINGLEPTNYFTIARYFIQNKTRDWVRTLYCNNHWSCLAAGLNNDDYIYIFDSMARKSVDNFLGDQVSRMMLKNITEQPIIRFKVQKTQQQQRTLCGYSSCAFATAICHRQNIEELLFDENKLIEHYIDCITKRKTSMFPHNKKKVYNTKKVIIEYQRRS